MAYNPDIPTADSLISQSQSQILANFTALNAVFQINHTAFNAATNRGKHTYVTMLEQATPAVVAGEGALWAENNAGITRLNFKTDLAVDIPLTGLTVTTVGTNNGVTLPSGIVVNWGRGTCAGGILVVTYAVPFIIAAGVPNVTARADNANTNNCIVDIGFAPTITKFRALSNQGAGQFYYFAIGV